MHKVSQSSVVGTASSGTYYGGSCKVAAPEDSGGDRFPAGLRVLVVDDDVICLRIVEQMLRRCSYHVTTCSQATGALNLLRERKGFFDVVLSDVYMPDMDGFKLLEHVGLEMDLPVIMMSADGSTNAVMKGVRHGACDYLIKPIREEELKNIWQHVVRKRWNGNRETEQSASLEDNDRHKRGSDDVDYASSVNEETEGTLKSQKKRSNPKEEDDGEFENDDPGTSKKPRVVWSVELHHQFVGAVNQLGIDKAVPKRILELMNVPGLTRENVASHLQKFRLYLKRLSLAQQGGISNSFCGPAELSKLGPLGRFDIQALAASGQIPSQTLAALHAELLGRPTGNLVLPAIDQPALLQASLQGSKGTSVEDVVPFGQLLMRSQSNTSKHFPQSVASVEDVPSGFGAWPSNALRTMGPNSNLGGLSTQNSNILKDILQQERQHQHNQHQQSLLPESSRSINVQPSCLVVPTQSSASFQGVNRSTSVNQNCNFNRSSVVDYRLLMPQPNISSFSIGQTSDGDTKPAVLLKGYQVPSSVSPSVSSCSVNVDNSRQLPELPPKTCDVQGSYGVKIGENLDQGLLRNLGFVGKGTCIPSRFAVDELESPISNPNHGKLYMENDGIRVKQEPNLDFMENAKVGIPILQHYSPNDLMSVLTE